MFSGSVRTCDVVIFVRKDYSDAMDAEDVCKIAPHLLSSTTAHGPPEHGGRVKTRDDLSGPYVSAMLLGINDSPNISALNPDLQDTGTYSVCLAPFGNTRPANECHSWAPNASEYGWYPDVQIHVRVRSSNHSPCCTHARTNTRTPTRHPPLCLTGPS